MGEEIYQEIFTRRGMGKRLNQNLGHSNSLFIRSRRRSDTKSERWHMRLSLQE